MRTLGAISREMLGAGPRLLSGAFLALFFVGYALGAVMLLPLVALVLTMAALPSLFRTAGRQLHAMGRQIRATGRLLRATTRSLRHTVLSTTVHARAALGWWLSVGGR